MLEEYHLLMVFVMLNVMVFMALMIGFPIMSLEVNSDPWKPDSLKLEMFWSVLPAFFLVLLGFNSLLNLYKMDSKEDYAVLFKSIGNQWYWSYEYSMTGVSDELSGMEKFPTSALNSENLELKKGVVLLKGQGFKKFLFGKELESALVSSVGLGGGHSLNFVSYMEEMSEMNLGDYRLLEVDNRAVCPGLVNVRVNVTSNDVIHSWAVPSLGVKMDAIPGRLNSCSFKAMSYGVFYGQCSEMCGAKHSFMPICLEVVPYGWFSLWLSEFSSK